MSTTITQIEMNTDYQSAIRFPAWMSLSVFSTICIIAISAQDDSASRTGEEKWALTVCVVSMILSFFAVLAYLFARGIYVAQIPEAAMIAVTIAIWGVGLPTIMNPANAIAVEGTEVINANLYFFSWMSFAVCIFLIGSLAQELFGIDARQAPPKTSRWFALCVSSLVVMGSATRIFNSGEFNCGNPNSGVSFCRRTKLAIAFGVLSCIFSGVMAVMSQYGFLTILIEMGTATLLLIFWCFGVGYITFGQNSPGSEIGNLYFSTWISFIAIVFIFSNAFRDIVNNTTQHQNQSSGGDGMDDQSNDMELQQDLPNHPAGDLPAEDDI